MTDVIGLGSLKLVSGWSPSRSLDRVLERMLIDKAGANDVRRLNEHAYVVYTDAEPSEMRAWLLDLVTDDESVFVVEFERWSSRGPGIDQRWLLRRGH
jgi:hypothetical protein